MSRRHTTNQSSDALRQMPCSLDGERGVLSCFLHNPELLVNAQETMGDDWFYHPANRLLYEILQSFRAEGRPVDYLILSQHLQDKGLIEKIGGQGALAELLDFVPMPTHYGHYSGILKDKYLLRQTFLLGEAAMQGAMEYHDDVAAFVQSIASKSISLAKSSSPPEVSMDQVMSEWENGWNDVATRKKVSAYSSRWQEWDKKLGGIKPGYTIIMGPRGSGKSVLCQNACTHMALFHDVPTLFISYEMKVNMVINRIIADMASVMGCYLFNPDLYPPGPEVSRAISNAVAKLSKSKLKIIHDVRLGVEALEAKIRSFHAKHGFCTVGIDYLQLIKPPKGKKTDNREQQVAGVSAVFRDLSKELDIPIFALSQVNKDGTSRESNAPEQDADDIVLIKRYQDQEGVTHEGPVLLQKNRNGDLGPLNMTFKGEYFRFV